MAVTNRPNYRWPARLSVAVALGLAFPGVGRAFFFAYGPVTWDSPAPPEASLVPAEKQEIVNRDWMPVPPDSPDSPNGPNEGPPGSQAPEPATGVAAAIGLALVGLVRRRRKMNG